MFINFQMFTMLINHNGDVKVRQTSTDSSCSKNKKKLTYKVCHRFSLCCNQGFYLAFALCCARQEIEVSRVENAAGILGIQSIPTITDTIKTTLWWPYIESPK